MTLKLSPLRIIQQIKTLKADVDVIKKIERYYQHTGHLDQEFLTILTSSSSIEEAVRKYTDNLYSYSCYGDQEGTIEASDFYVDEKY